MRKPGAGRAGRAGRHDRPGRRHHPGRDHPDRRHRLRPKTAARPDPRGALPARRGLAAPLRPAARLRRDAAVSLTVALAAANLALLLGLIAVVWLRTGRSAADDGVRRDLERLERALREDMARQRGEVGSALKDYGDSLTRQMTGMAGLLAERIGHLNETVERRLTKLQEDNGQRLDQMRQTVDEKLQGTLEKRLGESFKLVSERLEQVHLGLGEMRTLATGVGDLKKVLTNVKTRGTWGEIQLHALLEQVLAPEQYLKDAQCRDGAAERVEFAVRLPGRGGIDGEAEVLLPIDAKFPREDYERLIEASERGDPEAVEAAAKALEVRLRNAARDIFDKYVNPPRTTDFAILFLPTEGLYAEVLRRPGLVERLQRDYRVNLTGPTTLGALLNSLQMGFRTLAMQKRSSEVWEILGAVKTEFGKYGQMLDKVQKKLVEAQRTIDDVAIRRRAIDRKLRQVQSLPAPDAQALLGVDEEDAFADEMVEG
ncbi:MAG: DNA recombination protein RmuC [Alphaproteobacteria bacterium]|nr:DNA recombination protein RmuC [Alphaproteobacteria bacterium]